MPLRVLVVDDSSFFRQRLKDIISRHPDLTVCAMATNGREAVDKTLELKPDIITMDFEMPVMDGVTAVRLIMDQCPTPILMFSSLTYEGARVTMDALAAGALDFMPKDFGEVSRRAESLTRKLHERLLTLTQKAKVSALSEPEIESVPPAPVKGRGTAPELVIIGASTGGPIALMDVLGKLPEDFPSPILLVQHMPENFTKAFAERLNRQCRIQVREAVDGAPLEKGVALLAPGGKQMLVERKNGGYVKIMKDRRVTYKPSLDITFGSAAKQFENKTLGVVLTGMGADGRDGARMLKQAGGSIWAQDKASSVIYGMPMAIVDAGLADRVLSLSDMGTALAREVR